jgi:hypothetical protein
MHENIPVKTVTIGVNSQNFITPLAKQLLSRINRLMRKSRVLTDGEIFVEIGRLIVDYRARRQISICSIEVNYAHIL